MPFPTFLIGPALSLLGGLRGLHQRRRRVKLTVHQAVALFGSFDVGGENYYVTVTNASHDRDIEVTHIWFDTTPPVHVLDTGLPVRLRYSERWETAVPVSEVPADPAAALWLARCQLSPDDKVVKSRPRKNVPPFGTVPRSGGVVY